MIDEFRVRAYSCTMYYNALFGFDVKLFTVSSKIFNYSYQRKIISVATN